MIVNYDKSQLSVGQGIVSQIRTAFDDLKETINSDIDQFKSIASNYKVNLDSTLETNSIDNNCETLQTCLTETFDLANIQSGYIDEYESGSLASEANRMMLSQEELFSRKASSAASLVNPDVVSRSFATLGMGVFKFGEGFLSFFEDIGDAVLTVGSGTTSLLGFQDAANTLKSVAEYDFSSHIVEDNQAFIWINKHSYFDKDSTYANICKTVGKTAAAAVTTHVASQAYASRYSSTISDATKLEEQAQKFGKSFTKGARILKSEGANVRSELKDGKGFEEAVISGTAKTIVNQAVTDKVVKPVAEGAGSALSNTSVGNAIQAVNDKVGDVLGTKARDVLGSTVGTVAKASLIESKGLTGSVIGGNGNLQSSGDIVFEDVANTVIDSVSSIGSELVNQSLDDGTSS